MSAEHEIIEITIGRGDFDDMPPLIENDSEDDGSLPPLEDEEAAVVSEIARLIAINRFISPQSGLIHRNCRICKQFERAVINHIEDRGNNPGASTYEESRGLLDITQEIWLEHLIEDYGAFVRERQRIRDVIERSMDESKPLPLCATNDEIETLETKMYESERVAEGDGDPCAICLTEFEDGDMIVTTACSHLFHKDCISRWLRINVKCPVCRKNGITGEIVDAN